MMKWIKLWPEEWLNGTLRFTLDHKKRAVWADLLCLGGKSRIPGVICAGEESGKRIGYPAEYLAGITSVTPQELEETLKVFESQERVTVERENGRLIICLLNWSKYQVDYSRQSRYKAKQKKLHPKATPKVTLKGDALGDVKGDGEVEVEVDGEVDKDKNTSEPSAPSVCIPPEKKLEVETREAAFGVFWEAWPKKQAKGDALVAWMKIPMDQYGPIMAGLERWKKSEQWQRKVIPLPATWLNKKRWDDEDIPQEGTINGNHNAAAVRPEPGKYDKVKPIRAATA